MNPAGRPDHLSYAMAEEDRKQKECAEAERELLAAADRTVQVLRTNGGWAVTAGRLADAAARYRSAKGISQ